MCDCLPIAQQIRIQESGKFRWHDAWRSLYMLNAFQGVCLEPGMGVNAWAKGRDIPRYPQEQL